MRLPMHRNNPDKHLPKDGFCYIGSAAHGKFFSLLDFG